MSAKRSASTVSHKLPKSHAKSAKRPKLETSAIPKQYEQHVKLDAKKSIIFPPKPDWHAVKLPELPSIGNASTSQSHLAELHQYANNLLDEDSASYEAIQSKSSSKSFLSTFMSSGTLEDRVSALTLLVQESPIHNRKAFGSLLSLSKKKSRNQALIALSALKDLLSQGSVLPANRKLRSFARQPALLSALSEAKLAKSWKPADGLRGKLQKFHLMYWAFEDWLKKAYLELLRALEVWCNDEIEFARSRALTFVWELLKERPEQEENLLRLLVNKLGDKEKKISSRASYLLLQLQIHHPLMKGVIVSAIESDLLFRPGQSLHAKYYAVITLNQTVLSAKEKDVANKLLAIYFKLFAFLLAESHERNTTEPTSKRSSANGLNHQRRKFKLKDTKKANMQKGDNDLNEKMMSQLLTGVNRAFRFAQTDDATFESKMDTLFRTVHSSNFNTSVQALMLIQQVSNAKQFSAERFYRTLYESILDPRLLSSSKQIMYLNLLYQTLKSDLNVKRVKAFIKRLLQVVTLHEPPFACAIIYLVSELEKTFPSIKSMLEQAEENEDSDEEHFVDASEEIGGVQLANSSDNIEPKAPQSRVRYDGRKRDPEHSNADASCLWEIILFQSHYHPSVSLFAQRLLSQAEMPPKPDPTLHTLIHFLDRFTFKNAKARPNIARGSSIMQPSASTNTHDVLIRGRGAGLTETPLNNESFWSKASDSIAADQVFFHQYFNRTEKKKSKKSGKTQREAVSVEDSSENEQEIWDVLVQSNTELQDGHGDEDMDLDDLASESDDSNDFTLAQAEEPSEIDSNDQQDGLSVNDEDKDQLLLESDEEEGISVDLDEDEEDVKPSVKDRTNELRSERRKELKNLPTFAAVDEYADLLANEEEGDE